MRTPTGLLIAWVLIGLSGCESPVSPSAYDRAMDLYQQRQFAQAAQLLEQSVQSSPKDRDAWRYLGQSRFAVGQYREAIEAYSQAIGLAPDEAELYLLRSDAYRKLGEQELAQQDAMQAEKLDPRSRLALAFRGDRETAAGAGEPVETAAATGEPPEATDEGLIPEIDPFNIPSPTEPDSALRFGDEQGDGRDERESADTGSASAAERLGLLTQRPSQSDGPPEPPTLTPRSATGAAQNAGRPSGGRMAPSPGTGPLTGRPGAAAGGARQPTPDESPEDAPAEEEPPAEGPAAPAPRRILPGTASSIDSSPWGTLPYGGMSPGAYQPGTTGSLPTGVVGGTLRRPWETATPSYQGGRTLQGEFSMTPSPETWSGAGSFGGPSYLRTRPSAWSTGHPSATGSLSAYPGTYAGSNLGVSVAEGGYYPDVQVLNDPYGRPRDLFGRPQGSIEPVPTWGDIPPVSWGSDFRQGP